MKERDCTNCLDKSILVFRDGFPPSIDYCKTTRLVLNKYNFPDNCRHHNETFLMKLKRMLP